MIHKKQRTAPPLKESSLVLLSPSEATLIVLGSKNGASAGTSTGEQTLLKAASVFPLMGCPWVPRMQGRTGHRDGSAECNDLANLTLEGGWSFD